MQQGTDGRLDRASPWLVSALRGTLRHLRESYDWKASLDAASPHYSDRELPVTVATVTGTADFPGIVPMLTGLLTHVGRPAAIMVVDDGTLSPAQRDCIASISPLVQFHDPAIDPTRPAAAEMAAYARARPMGKKLAMLVELTTDGNRPVFYADTDIWFSPTCRPLIELLTNPIERCWYMHDESVTSLDSRVLPEAAPHVNSGFLLLPSHLEWDEALEHSRHLIADPEWFTEQTVVHRAVHFNGPAQLPPEQFVLRWDDRRSGTDHADDPRVAVRHYVTPVRHKFWVKAHGGYAGSALAVARHAMHPTGRSRRDVPEAAPHDTDPVDATAEQTS